MLSKLAKLLFMMIFDLKFRPTLKDKLVSPFPSIHAIIIIILLVSREHTKNKIYCNIHSRPHFLLNEDELIIVLLITSLHFHVHFVSWKQLPTFLSLIIFNEEESLLLQSFLFITFNQMASPFAIMSQYQVNCVVTTFWGNISKEKLRFYREKSIFYL